MSKWGVYKMVQITYLLITDVVYYKRVNKKCENIEQLNY